MFGFCGPAAPVSLTVTGVGFHDSVLLRVPVAELLGAGDHGVVPGVVGQAGDGCHADHHRLLQAGLVTVHREQVAVS